MNLEEGKKLIEEYDKSRSYTDNELESVNFYMEQFLNNIFKDNENSLDEESKKILQNYFDGFYSMTMENVDRYDQGVIYRLCDIYSYGLDGRSEDANYIISLNKNLAEDLNNSIEKALNQNDNSNWMTIMMMASSLARIDTDKTDTFNKVLDMLQDIGIDRYDNIIIDNYFERFVDKYKNVIQQNGNIAEMKPSQQKEFEFVMNYVKEVSSKKDFNILREQWVSDIFQLRYGPRLPLEYNIELYNILQLGKELPDNVYESVTDYIDSHQGQVIQNEEEFDEFIKNLGNVELHKRVDCYIKSQENKKIQKAILGKDATEFIIRQTLNPNSVISRNPEKYSPIVERAIEAKTRMDVAAKVQLGLEANLEEYLCFTRIEISGKPNTLGACYADLNFGPRFVELKREGINKLISDKDVSIFETIFHENTHTEQYYDMTMGKNDSITKYMMLKDTILSDYLESYYQSNYSYVFTEIDARKRAGEELENYLKNLGVNFNDITYRGARGEQILQILKQDIEKEKLAFSEGIRKFDSLSTDKTKNIFDIFDNLVKNNPDLLKKYPSLSLEYNPDGRKKTIQELLPLMSTLGDETSTQLFIHMITTSNIINKDNIEETISALNGYDCKDNDEAKVALVLIGKRGLKKAFEDLEKNTDSLDLEGIKELNGKMQRIRTALSKVKNGYLYAGLKHKNKGSKDSKSAMETFLELEKKCKMQEFEKIQTYVPKEENAQQQQNNYQNAQVGIHTFESSMSRVSALDRKVEMERISKIAQRNNMKKTDINMQEISDKADER